MYTKEYLLRVWQIHHGRLSAEHQRSFLARPELPVLMALPREDLDRAVRSNKRLVDIVASASRAPSDVRGANDSSSARTSQTPRPSDSTSEERVVARRESNSGAVSSDGAIGGERSGAQSREPSPPAKRDRGSDRAEGRTRGGIDRDDEISELVWLMVDGPGHEYPSDAKLGLYAKWGDADGRNQD